MRLYQKCKLLLLLPDYTDITNATYKLLLLLQDWPKMHTTNWCCYCKIILISQMQSANCCCYCKTRWKMHTATAIARWYHNCILQIAAVIARLYQKCLLQIAAFAKCCCHCQALSNMRIGKWFLKSRNTVNYNATLTVCILCFPPVRSKKEQRLLQSKNIFSSVLMIQNSNFNLERETLS